MTKDLKKDLAEVVDLIPDDWDWYKCKECGAKTNGDPWPELTRFIRIHHATIQKNAEGALRLKALKQAMGAYPKMKHFLLGRADEILREWKEKGDES